MMGIPLVYVVVAAFHVWHQGLIPSQEKCRLLVMYFGRLVFAFVIMWVPNMLVTFALGDVVPHQVIWVLSTWSHLHGGVAAATTLIKPDITEACRDFWSCCATTADHNRGKDRFGSTRALFSASARTFISTNNTNMPSDGLSVEMNEIEALENEGLPVEEEVDLSRNEEHQP